MPQPTPPRLVEAFAKNAPASTQAAPVAGGKNTVPTASQIGVVAGAASLNDGFPPLTMVLPGSNGVPPQGQDLNGILYVSTAWIAALAAGQIFPVYDATLQTAMGGYGLGAKLQQASNSLATWTSTANNNMTDPDTGGSGWLSSVALYSTAALSGANNVILPGSSDYVINIGSAAGPFTGFVPQRDGQTITFVNTSGGVVAFNALSGSSSGANQIQASGNIDVANNDSLTIKYSLGLAKWLVG
jgi:hypothetical protein